MNETPTYAVSTGTVITAYRNEKILGNIIGISYSITRSKEVNPDNPNDIKLGKKGIAGSMIISPDNYLYVKNKKEDAEPFDVRLVIFEDNTFKTMILSGIEIISEGSGGHGIDEPVVQEHMLAYIARNITSWKEYKEVLK